MASSLHHASDFVVELIIVVIQLQLVKAVILYIVNICDVMV